MRIKRLLAILLCFLLILSTLPVTVLADEGDSPEVTTEEQKPGSETSEEVPEAPGDEEEPQPEAGDDNPQPVTEPPAEEPEPGEEDPEPITEEELEEQEKQAPVLLQSDATPLTGHFNIEIRGSSPAFSADSFTLYANNHLETSDFSYLFTTETMVSLGIELEVYNEYSESYEEDSTDRVWVKLFLKYDLNTETVTATTEAHGLPQEILDGDVLTGRVSVNTTIPALREAFAAIGNPHPDIFHIKLAVSSCYPDGHVYAGQNINYIELTLRDVHVPIEEFWSSIDYDSFTLTTPMTPTLDLPEDVPAIVSLSADWYTFFYTMGNIEGEDENGSILPDPVAPIDGDGESVIEYLWPNWELETDPIPERFARYFGSGANVWITGPANDNHEVRGPENFIYGIAANKLSLSGTVFADLSVSLFSFMNSANRTYFNSLPGLSNESWRGYYTEEETEEWPADFESYWYELLAMANCILTVTYSDGVVYTVDLPFIRGNEDRQFHVVGDPIEVPIVVPDYVLIVPENQEIAYGETESRLGFATLEMGEDFPENGQVVVTVTRDAGFIHMDGRPETIPFLLAGWGFEEEFLAGTLNDRTSFTLGPQGLSAFPLAIYVSQDAWELAPPGRYAARITFTSRYEAP